MSNKQTSIEWLEEQLTYKYNNEILNKWFDWIDLKEYYDKAKEMHKQEMKECYEHGTFALLDMGHGDTFEQYYQKIFVSKESDDHISEIEKMVDVPQQQETLYTEEQVMEAMLQISEYYADNLGKDLDGHKKALEIIQSIKQPKK